MATSKPRSFKDALVGNTSTKTPAAAAAPAATYAPTLSDLQEALTGLFGLRPELNIFEHMDSENPIARGLYLTHYCTRDAPRAAAFVCSQPLCDIHEFLDSITYPTKAKQDIIKGLVRAVWTLITAQQH